MIDGFIPAHSLLISVGGSPGPIIHSIRASKPKKIIFFVSRESRKQVSAQILPFLLKDPGCIPDHECVVTPNEQDVGECAFTLLREVPRVMQKLGISNRTWPDVIDYTGGTKSMSAALVWASAFQPCRFSYVGTPSADGRTKEGLGVVIDGRERCFLQENPWDRVAFMQTREAVHAYNLGRYSVAAEQMDDLLERVTNDGLQRFLNVLGKVFKGFHAWDVFDHVQACQLLGKSHKALKDLAEGHESTLPGIKAFAADVEACFQRLVGIQPKQLTMESVLDLLSNARRRAAQELKYEDATARSYAAIEKFVQLRLREDHDIESENADPAKLPTSLVEEYRRRYEREITERSGQPTRKMQFGLTASMELLSALGHTVGARYEKRKQSIRDHLTQRNYSILAHGIQPLDEEKFRALFEDALYLMALKENDLTVFPVFALD